MKKTLLILLTVLVISGCQTDKQNSAEQIKEYANKIDSLESLLTLNTNNGEDYTRHYTTITFLSEGPIQWYGTPVNDVLGIAFRVSITTSEIYKNLYFDKVTYGEEGSNKKVALFKEIDLQKLNIFGEATSDLEFSTWLTYNSFTFKVNGKLYQVNITDEGEYKVNVK